MVNGFEITKLTKGTLPRVPFAVLKEKILGKTYELSLVIADIKHMKKMSTEHKGDDTHTNVLSFPLSKTSGELFICPQAIKKEAPDFGHSYEKHLKYIVIHGMLHLAGMTHGSKMEGEEKRLMSN
jgi:probable rRNA maturation factor